MRADRFEPADLTKPDAGYLRFIRSERCAVCGAPPPSVQAHHAGLRGAGQKCSDLCSVPLCDPCHDLFHDDKHGHARLVDKINTYHPGRRVVDLRAWWFEQACWHNRAYGFRLGQHQIQP